MIKGNVPNIPSSGNKTPEQQIIHFYSVFKTNLDLCHQYISLEITKPSSVLFLLYSKGHRGRTSSRYLVGLSVSVSL